MSDAEEVIANLHAAGLPPAVIARGVRIPEQQVRAVILNLNSSPHESLDEELADQVRGLAQLAVTEAEHMLRYGPANQKLAIIKPFLATLARHVATQSSDDQEEARQALTTLLSEMRDVPELEPFVTATATEFLPVDLPERVTE